MLKTSPAESILALFTGPTRAAAIMGDLEEIASTRTRTRTWFWTTYLRTLLSLTWRILLALFAAELCRQLIFDTFHLYLQHTPASWRTAGGPYLNLLNASGPLLACIMSTLWFALPFAAVRYGLSDPFVRLTFAVTLGTTTALFAIPFASALAASATLALVAAALLSPTWRRPAAALTAIGICGLAALAGVQWLMPHIISLRAHLPKPLLAHAAHLPLPMLAFQTSLLLVAVACARLHAHLLPSNPAGDTHVEPA